MLIFINIQALFLFIVSYSVSAVFKSGTLNSGRPWMKSQWEYDRRSQVGVVEEVEVGVWRPPVGAGAGAEAATGLSEPVIPVRVLMNGNSPEKV